MVVMVEILATPLLSPVTSQPVSFKSSSSVSSLASSRLEFGNVNPEIVRRNLVTDFLEATSLPVNVPIHKDREAMQPNTPMREEFDRCTKRLTFSLACKLFSFKNENEDAFEDKLCRNKGVDDTNKRVLCDELMFRLEL